MGEGLIIKTSLASAREILKTLKDPELLFWEEHGHHLDALAKWLPKKGFKVLPKFFDKDYVPGAVGDEGDEIVARAGGCSLRVEGEERFPVWYSHILRIPEVRQELKRILEGNVLDMGFEEEVAREVLEAHGEKLYEASEEDLEGDNENLRRFAEIMVELAECADRAMENGGYPVHFEFCIPRPDKSFVEKMAMEWLKGQGEKRIRHG